MGLSNEGMSPSNTSNKGDETMKNKCFLKVIAPITFFIMVLVGTVSTTSIAQPTNPAVTPMSTNMIQGSNNTDSYYQEQNDPENEETINESDAENTEEDKENESESEAVGIEENNIQQNLPAGKAVISADNPNSQYEEQNGSEDGEAINESNDENVQEDRENESENEDEGIDSNDKQDDIPANKAVITFDAAKQIAESFLNGGSATKITLDDENGKLVYSVEVGSIDVKVDATNGTVLYTDKQ